MTGILLDTNAWSMVLTGDERLPDTARARIERASLVAVSTISLYEIGQKVRLGKWPEMEAVMRQLPERAREDGLHLLPVSPEISLHAALLDWSHRDPFDRIIGATAMLMGMAIVSSDDAFNDFPELNRVWR